MDVPRQLHIVLSVFITVFLTAAAVHAQRDACGAELNTFLPRPFNSTRFICKSVWNNFILRHSLFEDEDNVTSIVLSAAYSSGWVGIGFSNDGKMVGSSAMVGWIDNQGRAYIKQYYLSKQTSSGVKVDGGKLITADVTSAVVLYGDNIYLAFQVKYPLHIVRHSVILAYSTILPNKFLLVEHDDKMSLSFDFSSGDSVSTYYPYQLKRNHGALTIFGWGILIPLGAIVARYLRHKEPLWYYLHVLLQFLGYIIGLAGVVSGIALYNRTHSNSLHIETLAFRFLLLVLFRLLHFSFILIRTLKYENIGISTTIG
ncbi:hypothetical protein GUJ93_ZPchr0005g15508 [Zizania palustris]|uniref:DOMON domain-containing protein n=1 Tax=Zizania palustris TaxID=103762 RepID=A0A8J5SMK8_ZIZPA|nr:hypothetical protein GUJ93_ZPchr0005g15508 [Zizania palustris]